MKIAMMTNNYKPFVAGVPVSIERLTISLRKLGHQIVVFAPSYDGQEPEPDVIRYGALLKGVAGGFSVPNSFDPGIERQFRKGKFDLIHVHHPMMIGRMARHLSAKYKVPLVYTYHTRYEQYLHYVGLSGLKGIMPVYLRNCMRACDVVIAPTLQMKENLKELKVEAAVKVLPTGLPEDSFCPNQTEANRLRRELLGDSTYLFCTVARLAKEKNLLFLLESLKIRKDVEGGDFKLALIGAGPEENHLKEQAKRMGLSREILFVGQIPNEQIKNYCLAADLFLFSSKSETQGIVLLEAMAAGTPVLAVSATGTEDVVISGENGYLTGDDPGEFSARLMDILDKRELEWLSRGAVRTAENYHCERIATEAVSIYEAVIRQRNTVHHSGSLPGNTRQDMIYSQG